jgi:hypothetical protein
MKQNGILQALKIKSNDPSVLTARSGCHMKLGNLKMALDDIDTILKEDPLNHRVSYVCVLFYIK